MSYNWLELGVINTIERFYYNQVISYSFFFKNRLFNWSKMLLVREVNMVEERAFTRQEGASNFEGLGMPVFRLFMLDTRVIRRVFLHLEDESDFG